jgi:hypothetical protein
MHNTFTTVLFIYIRLHVSALYGPSSGRYKVPSNQVRAEYDKINTTQHNTTNINNKLKYFNFLKYFNYLF